MKKALLTAWIMGLVGCAQAPYWVQTTEPSKQVKIVYLDVMPWKHIRGYVTRTGPICNVYVKRGSPDCVLEHELQHCKGLSHPHYSEGLSFSCP